MKLSEFLTAIGSGLTPQRSREALSPARLAQLKTDLAELHYARQRAAFESRSFFVSNERSEG